MSSFDFTRGDVWGGRPIARSIFQITARYRLIVTGIIRDEAVVDIGGSWSGSFLFDDGTGKIQLVFLGRPIVTGLSIGTRCTIEGTARADAGELVVWNPLYRIELPSGSEP